MTPHWSIETAHGGSIHTQQSEIPADQGFCPGKPVDQFMLLFSHCHVWVFGNPLDYNLPRSCVHGVFQARVLESTAISFSRRFSRPRDQTHVSCTGRQILYPWATGKPWATYTNPHLQGQPHLSRYYWFTFSLAYLCHVMILRSRLYLSLLLQGKLFFSSNTLMGQTNFRRSHQN